MFSVVILLFGEHILGKGVGNEVQVGAWILGSITQLPTHLPMSFAKTLS